MESEIINSIWVHLWLGSIKGILSEVDSNKLQHRGRLLWRLVLDHAGGEQSLIRRCHVHFPPIVLIVQSQCQINIFFGSALIWGNKLIRITKFYWFDLFIHANLKTAPVVRNYITLIRLMNDVEQLVCQWSIPLTHTNNKLVLIINE